MYILQECEVGVVDHVINSPPCRCGAVQETAYYYFMECILYDDQHLELIDVVSTICPFEFKTLMHGNEDLSYQDNCCIFDVYSNI